MSKPWIRAAQWALGAAVIILVVRSFVRNWDELRAQPLGIDLRPLWLLASAALVWLTYAMLIVVWRLMLRSWGQNLDGWTAARIWIVSGLGKYLPGKVWAIAGLALMSQQAGVAPWAATASSIILQVVAIGTGAAVVGLTGVPLLETAHPGARTALLLLVIGSAVGVGLLLWPPVLRRLLRAVPRKWGNGADRPGKDKRDDTRSAVPAEYSQTPARAAMAVGIAAHAAAWVSYGVALWLLAKGILPGINLDLPSAIAVFTASYLAGFLALLAPGGIGVREGVFILMLQGPIGLAAATALAVASRLLLTVADLGAAAPLLAFPRRRARVAL